MSLAKATKLQVHIQLNALNISKGLDRYLNLCQIASHCTALTYTHARTCIIAITSEAKEHTKNSNTTQQIATTITITAAPRVNSRLFINV